MTLVIKIESTPVFYADKFILIDGRNLPLVVVITPLLYQPDN